MKRLLLFPVLTALFYGTIAFASVSPQPRSLAARSETATNAQEAAGTPQGADVETHSESPVSPTSLLPNLFTLLMWILLIVNLCANIEQQQQLKRQSHRITNQSLEIATLVSQVQRLQAPPPTLDNRSWFPVWVDSIKGHG